jgi:hypothetical protein
MFTPPAIDHRNHPNFQRLTANYTVQAADFFADEQAVQYLSRQLGHCLFGPSALQQGDGVNTQQITSTLQVCAECF